MIRVIGLQRVLILVLLAVLLGALFFYGMFVLKPEIVREQRELALNQSKISEMTANMDKLVQGMELFTEQKEEFEVIQKYGFFDPQNRVLARQHLNLMQKESRLLSAKYTIKPAVTEKNKIALEAGYKVLNTDIEFILEAIEDLDIYNFIYLLNYGFPGQISIKELKISRDQEVTQPLLRQIGVGKATPLVKAVFLVNWRTMVADDSLSISSEEEIQ